MASPVRQRGFLLSLAAEGIVPLIRGCAAGPISQGKDHAINVFGPVIVECWRDWMRDQPPGTRHAAISELADLSAAKARTEAISAVERLAQGASVEDRAVAVEYLCALPRSSQASLVLDQTSGGRVLPTGFLPDDPDVLLRLLPIDAPPYPPGSQLPGTAFVLGDVLSTLNGVTYRATRDGDAVTIRFPHPLSDFDLLRQQRPLLERLRDLGRGAWSERLVRLLDFDVEHATPYLVYEPVSGGDLAVLLLNLREQAHRGFTADEILRLVEQVAEGLAFAHQNGLVHGDLKPSNVVVSGDAVRLSNLGGVPAFREESHSPASRARRWRGADSLISVALPELTKDESDDPRDDLYSLGVLWYQLLTGDVTRRPTIDEAKQLAIPQRDLLVRCLGPRAVRPPDASAFLVELRSGPARILTEEKHAASVVSPEEIRLQRQRKRELLHGLKEARDRQRDWTRKRHEARRLSRLDIWLALPAAALVFLAVFLPTREFILANLLGLCAGMLFLLRRFQGRRKAAQMARAKLEQEIELLALQSPDDVQSWGGPHALSNAELLPEIIAALEEDMRNLAIQEQEEQSE